MSTGSAALVRVGPLPDEALAAAGRFHAEVLPRVLAAIRQQPACVILVFGHADHTHAGWRIAVVQQLARVHAPCRVNAVESDDEAAIAAAAVFADAADGLTGQVLPLDGIGADKVPYSRL